MAHSGRMAGGFNANDYEEQKERAGAVYTPTHATQVHTTLPNAPGSPDWKCDKLAKGKGKGKR